MTFAALFARAVDEACRDVARMQGPRPPFERLKRMAMEWTDLVLREREAML